MSPCAVKCCHHAHHTAFTMHLHIATAHAHWCHYTCTPLSPCTSNNCHHAEHTSVSIQAHCCHHTAHSCRKHSTPLPSWTAHRAAVTKHSTPMTTIIMNSIAITMHSAPLSPFTAHNCHHALPPPPSYHACRSSSTGHNMHNSSRKTQHTTGLLKTRLKTKLLKHTKHLITATYSYVRKLCQSVYMNITIHTCLGKYACMCNILYPLIVLHYIFYLF